MGPDPRIVRSAEVDVDRREVIDALVRATLALDEVRICRARQQLSGMMRRGLMPALDLAPGSIRHDARTLHDRSRRKSLRCPT